MKLGIVIGRFQTPYLYPGHLHLIATALRKSDKVLILLGSNGIIDEKNPYTNNERVATIRKIFPQIQFFVINDMESDEEWSKHIDRLIGVTYPYDTHTLFYSHNSFIDSYSGNIKTEEIEEVVGYSATKIREQIKNKENDKKFNKDADVRED